jgi:5-methylthioribose kinase
MGSKGILLSPLTLPTYLHSLGLAEQSDDIKVRELGGGVSNIVLLVEFRGRRWVVKQALGKLRVEDEWLSDPERVIHEARSLRALRPILGEAAVPEVIHLDHDNLLFIMTAAPSEALPWKECLLGRRIDLAIARQAGVLLARMINGSRAEPQLARQFADRNVFQQLRLDPYYRTTAARHPEVQQNLRELIADTLKIQTALVHGDYSPKNMLVHGHDIMLIDFEVVHWGDPAFDAAFLLNHLCLKAFHQPVAAAAYIDAARAFWETLHAALGSKEWASFETMTVRHLGALMLARIDGKSPAEYLRDEGTRERVRRVAKWILLRQPQELVEVIDMVLGEIRDRN